MSNNFEELFKDFFLKLTVLNYKVTLGIALGDEYENIKNSMAIVMPIFNRILSDKTLVLKDIIDDTKENTKEKNKIESNLDDNDYFFVNDHTTNNTSIVSYNTASVQSDDEPDIEGDKLVEELNKKSLEKLEEYKKNNILWIEEDDSTDISSEDNTSSVDETDGYESDDSFSIDLDNDKFNETLRDYV